MRERPVNNEFSQVPINTDLSCSEDLPVCRRWWAGLSNGRMVWLLPLTPRVDSEEEPKNKKIRVSYNNKSNH